MEQHIERVDTDAESERDTTEGQTGEEYGFSVKKGGNDELLAAINDAIASDEYDAVYEKWFGTAPTK